VPDSPNKDLQDFYERQALGYPEVDETARARCDKAVGLAGVANGMSVLDIACKDGVLLRAIQGSGQQVVYTGVDISERVIAKNLENRLGGTFLRADVLAGLSLPDLSFDRIFALEILEHLPQPERLLVEARRLLKPDGRLVLSVPNPYYYMEIVNELRRRSDTDGHLYSFTRANLGALLARCGFGVEDSAGTCLLVPRTLRHPFRAQKLWVLKNVPEFFACSRIVLCRKEPPG
jgi:SAM-dependent methyltransferase